MQAGPNGVLRYRVYCAGEPGAAGAGADAAWLHADAGGLRGRDGDEPLAEAEGLVVVYPEQTRGENSHGVLELVPPRRPGARGGGAGVLAGLARAVAEAQGVPADRVFVAGLSAGGAMAAVLAGTYPDVFAAAGVHSGLAHRSAGDVLSAFAAMRGDGGAAPAGATGARG